MLAAVLAIVCALVPDPVTVARAPAAYVPLDSALFAPIGYSQPPIATAPGATRAAAADRVVDGPLTESDLIAPSGTPPAPPVGVAGGQLVHAPVGWRTTEVSWYGPGSYGRRTACGEAMTTTLVGVAHRTLPCGTLVQFRWNGRVVNAHVVDRGPYVGGRLWDLTAGLCALLGHCFTGPISWKVP